MERVVITGLGMINGVGNSVKESFDAIVEGKTGVDNITLFDTSNFSVKFASEVKNFDSTAIMGKKEAKKADRFIHFGLHSALEAMKDSKLCGEDGKLSDKIAPNFGVSAGSGIGGLPNIEQNSIILDKRGPGRISPFFIPSSLSNMLGGFVSIYHNLKGPNLASVTACAASSHAIIEAFKTIVLGGADGMLVVGSESAICGAGIGGFSAMKALSTRNDDPKTASRPFDKDRDGFVMGEGSGALVLETLSSAQKRGAKIYCEILGFGESGDANHITAPVIDGPLRAMKAAVKMAKNNSIDDFKIDYVNCHGTSTPIGDLNESKAIKSLFKDEGYFPLVSSTKGQVGHCLGAAGAIEAIITIKALDESILPPTINVFNMDDEIDLDCIANKARKCKAKIAVSNNFGFGGTNSSLIIRKFED